MRYAIFSSVRKKYLLYAFFAGVILGALFLNIFASDYFDEIGVFSKYFIDKFNAITIDKSDLLNYTLLSRVKELGLVFILSFTVISTLYNTFYCVALGFSTGIFVSSLTINYGIKGVWYYLITIFPHYIVYIILIVITINRSIMINKYIYHRNSEHNFEGKKYIIKHIFLCIFFILLLSLLEALAEVYLNSPILKNVLRSL